jgi:PAP2 superfamily protein
MQQTAATVDFSGSAVGASPSRKALFVAGVQSQLIFAGAIGLYWVAYRLFVRSHQNVVNTDVLELLLSFFIFSIPILLLAHVVMRFWHMCRHVRPKRPSLWLVKDGVAFFSDPKRLALGLPMVVLLNLFMDIFTDIKKNIPNLVPFSWDQTFAEWDRIFHFGSHPWEWLQPILGYGPVTLIVNFSYNFWFMVMWMLWMHFAFARETSILRTRFFLSFILTWAIGGSLAAVFLSSAGPCYYTLIGLSPDPYAELMAYLRQTNETYPLMAIGIQDVLWSSYVNKAMIAGISAMPSMHNAASLLFALTGWHMSRRMGWILSAHCAAVYIGSIHLGWHYAIDAYVGWAIALAIWMICKPVAEWWERQPAMLRASRVFQAQTVAPTQGMAAA